MVAGNAGSKPMPGYFKFQNATLNLRRLWLKIASWCEKETPSGKGVSG